VGRLIVVIVLVVLAVWLVRRALRRAQAPRDQPAVPGELVACARCGVHLPRGEAREAAGRLYCGEEHARLGGR
jgi:uncharacterized protein